MTMTAGVTQEGHLPATTLAHWAFALAPHGRRAPQHDHLVIMLPPRARRQGSRPRPGSLTKLLTASGCGNTVSTRDSREAPCRAQGHRQNEGTSLPCPRQGTVLSPVVQTGKSFRETKGVP